MANKKQGRASAGASAAEQKQRGTIRISISMTPEERELVRAYAQNQGATVSGLVRKWIRENCK